MDRTQEIMQKVRRIELQARKLASATFAGQYRSGFRGQGLDFDDFREYMPGDEPRFIDWKVTARTGTPYIRRFHEEREQVLLLAVDASGSMGYASQPDSKLEYAALLAAVLAYSAVQNGDKIGLLLYGRHPHFYLPPAKGMRQCLRIVREILSTPAGGQDDTVDAVAREILLTQRKPAIVFLVSDFFGKPDQQAIGKLAFRHELIPVRVNDPAELELPDAGFVCLQDPETGELVEADLSDPGLRNTHARTMAAHNREWDRCFTQLGIDALSLTTGSDFIPPLRKLFSRRSRLFTR